jgi:hypothetical protein
VGNLDEKGIPNDLFQKFGRLDIEFHSVDRPATRESRRNPVVFASFKI